MSIFIGEGGSKLPCCICKAVPPPLPDPVPEPDVDPESELVGSAVLAELVLLVDGVEVLLVSAIAIEAKKKTISI